MERRSKKCSNTELKKRMDYLYKRDGYFSFGIDENGKVIGEFFHPPESDGRPQKAIQIQHYCLYNKSSD